MGPIPSSSLALPAAATKTHFVDISVSWIWWVAVVAVFATLLAIDILVLHRDDKVPKLGRALGETLVWVSIGLGFGLVTLVAFGSRAAGEYYSGYLIELSLSIDNVFVWALLFTFFAVPRAFQHRVLFWGVFGAVILRAMFVFAGVALVQRFDWILIVFGVLLLVTAYRLVTQDDIEMDPERNLMLRVVRKLVPTTADYDGHKLFTMREGKRIATHLFVVLVMVEATDLLFAIDSVPAVLGVSNEQFIVLTSNAFAILGLRALYFLLADLHSRFSYLQLGLAVILAFVGIKMIAAHWFHISTGVSLLVISLVLTLSIIASVARTPRVDQISVASDETEPPFDER